MKRSRYDAPPPKKLGRERGGGPAGRSSGHLGAPRSLRDLNFGSSGFRGGGREPLCRTRGGRRRSAGAGDGAGRGDAADLAHAFRAVAADLVGHLDQDDVDVGHVLGRTMPTSRRPSESGMPSVEGKSSESA